MPKMNILFSDICLMTGNNFYVNSASPPDIKQNILVNMNVKFYS